MWWGFEDLRRFVIFFWLWNGGEQKRNTNDVYAAEAGVTRVKTHDLRVESSLTQNLKWNVTISVLYNLWCCRYLNGVNLGLTHGMGSRQIIVLRLHILV